MEIGKMTMGMRKPKMSDKEIVQYYGQIWGNVKHMKSYVEELKERYKKENEDES